MVDEINMHILSLIPTEEKVYLSSDTICKISIDATVEDVLYPTEFFSSLKFNDIPHHNLKLKIRAPIMLLPNINQSAGLYNGTKLIVT